MLGVSTCSVDVEVSRFTGHIANRFQTWATGLYLVWITKSFGHIYKKGALIYVLSSKQNLYLEKIRNTKHMR